MAPVDCTFGVDDEGGDPKKKDNWARFLKAASTWPFSYAERGDKVVFTLGNPTVVRTLHVSIREEYEPSLEKVVTEHAKVDLDTSLRRLLVDGEAPGNASLVKILPWLPKTAEGEYHALPVGSTFGALALVALLSSRG